jgi:hypothetical protein
VAPAVTTAGPEAAEIARRVGVHLDPWQLMGLDAVLGQDADGGWAAAETCTVAGRQTGKNGLVEPVELYGLFMLDENILHTAHRLDASRGSHERLWQLIKRDPVLLRRVEKRRTANEEQSILLDSGAKIEFTVRSDEGGRSKTYDRIVVDEAFAATFGHMGAILPTLISKQWWQINYLSSAGHARSLVLHGLRKRGIAGAPGLTYLEWSADPARYRQSPTRARTDRVLLRQALPALGGRLSYETIEKLAVALSPEEFDREVLCIWDEPILVLTEWAGGITEAEWTGAGDVGSTPLDPVAFVVDVTPDRSRTAIGMAAWRADGRRTVEIVDERPGTGWVPARLAELARSWDPAVVAMDDAGPAGGLREAIVDEDLDVEVLTARQVGQAYGRFVDGVRNGQLRHRADPRLTAAVKGGSTKALAGARTWDAAGEVPVHTVRAVTFADWALARFGRVPPPPAAPRSIPAGEDSATGDLMEIGF